MNKRTRVQNNIISRLGVGIALSAATVLFPKIPNGVGGYLHFGNAIIFIYAIIYGSLTAGIVGGVGHSIADLINGRLIYVLPTFIIKFLVGVVFGKIYNKTRRSVILAVFVSFIITTFGYFLFKWFIYGNFKFALVSILCNLVTSIINTIIILALLPFLNILKPRLGVKETK